MPRAAGVALAAALAAGPAGAQVRASLDAGVSHVEYQGFLPSAAFSLTPALRVTGRHFGLATRGTWLKFESGNSSLQGLVAGSVLLPAVPHIAAELGGELGGSSYEAFATFSHILGRARLQVTGSGGGSGWVAATLGTAASDSGRHTVQTLGAAFRLDRRDLSFTLAGTGTLIGDVGYADFETIIRHFRPGGFEAEAVVSARAGDSGGDPGPFLEATLSLPLSRHAAVVLAGGRYASDAVRGNIAGSYVTAALRLALPAQTRRTIPLALPPGSPAGDEGTVAATLVDLRLGRGQARTLVFRAAGASSVEVMADFTDWLPIALQPAGPDRWSVTLPIAPGRHRLNLRVNGGPWGVPVGTTLAADDFQGTVGAVVIP